MYVIIYILYVQVTLHVQVTTYSKKENKKCISFQALVKEKTYFLLIDQTSKG